METIKVCSEYLENYFDIKKVVDNSFSELETLVLQIKQELIKDGWKGESKIQCINIVRMTEEYCKVLYDLYEKLNESIKELEYNKDIFHTDSSEMAALKMI